MTPNDRKAFIEVVIGFAELKGKQLSAPALELYWRSLQHWGLEDFKVAAEHLLRTCEFMPLPKDFENLRKAGRPTTGEAWAQVLAFARKGFVLWEGGGASRNSAVGEPDDPVVNRAVEMVGGYRAIAMSDTDKTQFLERRFCEHYESLQDAEDVRESVPAIAYTSPRALNGPQRVGKLLGRDKQ